MLRALASSDLQMGMRTFILAEKEMSSKDILVVV